MDALKPHTDARFHPSLLLQGKLSLFILCNAISFSVSSKKQFYEKGVVLFLWSATTTINFCVFPIGRGFFGFLFSPKNITLLLPAQRMPLPPFWVPHLFQVCHSTAPPDWADTKRRPERKVLIFGRKNETPRLQAPTHLDPTLLGSTPIGTPAEKEKKKKEKTNKKEKRPPQTQKDRER